MDSHCHSFSANIAVYHPFAVTEKKAGMLSWSEALSDRVTTSGNTHIPAMWVVGIVTLQLLLQASWRFWIQSDVDDIIDKKYTQHPFYGILRMTAWLHDEGYHVNHKRVQRLMQLMGLRAIYPKPKISKSECVSEKYPYLLRGLVVRKPCQVWGTDITYIRLRQGFVYLVAVMDWFSRYVLSWEVSNSLDTHFCLSALEKAFAKGTPEIFNSDQGSQFETVANRIEL
jgi:hypothetical protein